MTLLSECIQLSLELNQIKPVHYSVFLVNPDI